MYIFYRNKMASRTSSPPAFPYRYKGHLLLRVREVEGGVLLYGTLSNWGPLKSVFMQSLYSLQNLTYLLPSAADSHLEESLYIYMCVCVTLRNAIIACATGKRMCHACSGSSAPAQQKRLSHKL